MNSQRMIRKALLGLRGKKTYIYPTLPETTITPAETQDRIMRMLSAEAPCMIARFGSVELQAIVDYLYQPTFKNAVRFINGDIPSWGYAPSTLRTMHINAGFFPSTPKNLNRFGAIMVECMQMVDILGSWRPEESVVLPYMSQAIRVPLHALEPYYFNNPWTPALEGKRVLVIHPFEETIKKQHARYDKLFDNKLLCPRYELLTIKAVQSIAGNRPEQFNDWFDALTWMKHEIDDKDFDIAIIGCGAYGFPLAAYVKAKGKKSIHLGGAVANLFGVLSEGNRENVYLNPLKNSFWCHPSKKETPLNANLVENGRYW